MGSTVGGAKIRYLFTAVDGGASVGPYRSMNLSNGVGDDPEAVLQNRSSLADRIGLDLSAIRWMDQVHGTQVAAVDRHSIAPVAVDGMITAASNLALAVLVADCVPVLAADASAGIVGVAHAGRLGAAAGIVPNLLSRMAGAGARIEAVELILGPAICGRCYEVPALMRDEVEALLPGSACRTAAGTPGLDLRAGISAGARAMGVGRVGADPRCTKEVPALFSHRRGAPTGRFAGLIWMADPAVEHGVSQHDRALSGR